LYEEIFYKISDDKTLLETYDFETNEQIKSVPIDNLDVEVNSILVSPDNEYFVAFGDLESRSTTIQFFTINGQLIQTQRVRLYPKVSFSLLGEYVCLFDYFGNEFYFFRHTGDEYFKGNYVSFLDGNDAVLYHIQISDDGDLFLMYTTEVLRLISFKEGLVWKKNYPLVTNSAIYPQQKVIALKILKSTLDQGYSLRIISVNDGMTLVEMNNLDGIYFKGRKIYINQKNIYRVYEIK
jgi:WD40 repeat protein